MLAPHVLCVDQQLARVSRDGAGGGVCSPAVRCALHGETVWWLQLHNGAGAPSSTQRACLGG